MVSGRRDEDGVEMCNHGATDVKLVVVVGKDISRKRLQRGIRSIEWEGKLLSACQLMR